MSGAAWADKKRSMGYRDRLVWMTPEAEVALESLRSKNKDASLAEIVSQAVVQYSSLGFVSVKHDIVKFDFFGAIEELYDRVKALEDLQHTEQVDQPDFIEVLFD